MKVFGHDGKNVLWGVVGDHVVGDPTDHGEIVLRGFDFNLFDEDEKRLGREGSSEFTYLLMLIRICPGNWKTQLNRMNEKANEYNVKASGKYNRRY